MKSTSTRILFNRRFLKQVLPGLSLLFATVLPLGHQAQASPVTLDFASAPAGATPLPYQEDGFDIIRLDNFGAWATANSPAQQTLVGGNGAIRLKRTDNGTFDILSLLVKSRGSEDALGTFNLLTSTGGSHDLTSVGTHNFSGPGFEGVSHVDFIIVRAGVHNDVVHLDNIVLQNTISAGVPDAGGTGLLLSGVVGMAGYFRRQMRRD